MTKYLKIVFFMMAVFGLLASMSQAGTISSPTSLATVAQEAACTCYYNDASQGWFGTLTLPEPLIYDLGVSYGCIPWSVGTGGNNQATIKFTLSASATGNCSWQHGQAGANVGNPPYPNFWTTGIGGVYYLQVADPSGPGGWTCLAQGGSTNDPSPGKPQIFEQIGGGKGYGYVEFKVREAAMGGKLGLGGISVFASGTRYRLSQGCDTEPNIAVDACTLCTNCSTVSVTKTGTAVCPPTSAYDPCNSSCPDTFFRSQNQFATAIIPGYEGQSFSTRIFDGVPNVGYAPETDRPPNPDKMFTGFMNNPQTWNCTNNWADKFCFYFCNNDIACGDYCCSGYSHFGIDETYMVKESGEIGFDILRKDKKWTKEPVGLKAWKVLETDSCSCDGAATASACNNGTSVTWPNYPHASDFWKECALPMDTTTKGKQRICTLAEVTPGPVIHRSSFWLDWAKLTAGSRLTGADTYFGTEGITVLPPAAHRFAGEWKYNTAQFIVPFVYGHQDVRTRCMISNKSANAVRVYVDVHAAERCMGEVDRVACLTAFEAVQQQYMGPIMSQGLKMIELSTKLVPYTWQAGAECSCESPACQFNEGCPQGVTWPMTVALANERYAATITVANDPGEVGPPPGDSYGLTTPEVVMTCTQRDANTGNWRTVNIENISSFVTATISR